MANVNRFVNTGSVGGDGTTNNKTGANAAYASRSSWNTSEATDLITDTDIHILQCDGDGGTDDTTKLTLSAWVTGASNFITVTNVNLYKMGGTNNYSKLFVMQEDYYREDGFTGENLATFANSSNGDAVLYVGSAGGSLSDIRFNNVHILGCARDGVIHGGGVGLYQNILIEDCGGQYGFFATYNSSAPNGTQLKQFTAVNSGTIEAVGTSNANYLTAKNGYAHDNGSSGGSYGANVQTNYVTCAASDPTSSSAALDNVAFSTVNFENVSSGTEDLRIKLGSILIGGGTDISADLNWLSTDLDGVNWESVPSIGAYELVVGTGSTGTVNVIDEDDTITGQGTSAQSGTTGTLNETDLDDTSTSSGTQIYLGTVDQTLTDDTINANGLSTIVGTLVETDLDDTSTSSGTQIFTGTLVETDLDDTSETSGTPIYISTLNYTDNDDIISSLGSSISIGSLNTIEEDDTSNIISIQSFLGSLNISDDDDSTLIDGFSTSTDTLNATDADDIIESSGSSITNITSTSNTTDFDDTIVSYGSEIISGVSNIIDINDYIDSTGTSIISGAIDTTDNDDVSSTSGNIVYTSTLNTTDLDDVTVANGYSLQAIIGSLNVINSDDIATMSGSGTNSIFGSVIISEINDISYSVGTIIDYVEYTNINIITKKDHYIWSLPKELIKWNFIKKENTIINSIDPKILKEWK